MKKPKILSGIFCGDIKNSLYKLFLQTIIKQVNQFINYEFNKFQMTYSRKENISIPQGKEKLEFVYSYVLLKLIQIMNIYIFAQFTYFSLDSRSK